MILGGNGVGILKQTVGQGALAVVDMGDDAESFGYVSYSSFDRLQSYGIKHRNYAKNYRGSAVSAALPVWGSVSPQCAV